MVTSQALARPAEFLPLSETEFFRWGMAREISSSFWAGMARRRRSRSSARRRGGSIRSAHSSLSVNGRFMETLWRRFLAKIAKIAKYDQCTLSEFSRSASNLTNPLSLTAKSRPVDIRKT